jgi:RNA polymerase sigma-70 factor (ECF subfamily)
MNMVASSHGDSVNDHEPLGDDARDVLTCQGNYESPEALEAFERIVSRNKQRLYVICYGYMKDHHKADALSMDVFHIAWKKIAQLKDPNKLAGWLRMIAFHKAYAMQRSENRHVHQVVRPYGDDFEGAVSDGQSDVLTNMIRQEEGQRIRMGLLELKDLDRETLEAHYLRGRSYDQMVADFNSPLGTIKRRLNVARLRLKAVLEGSDLDPASAEF